MNRPLIFIGYDNYSTAVLHPTDHTCNAQLLMENWEPHAFVSSRGYTPECSIYTGRDRLECIKQYITWAQVTQEQQALLAATLGIEP